MSDVVKFEHKHHDGFNKSKYTIDVCGTIFKAESDNTPKQDIAVLSVFAKALEYADQLAEDDIRDRLEDWVSYLAEEAEVEFSYVRAVDGRKRTYSPAAHWEASDSCSEWEQSAEYGINYGWDI